MSAHKKVYIKTTYVVRIKTKKAEFIANLASSLSLNKAKKQGQNQQESCQHLQKVSYSTWKGVSLGIFSPDTGNEVQVEVQLQESPILIPQGERLNAEGYKLQKEVKFWG